MALKRIILEMGTGNDLHGKDYTKAAVRAVEDALHHSSIVLFKSTGLDRDAMQIEVTIGVQQPAQINAEVVAATLPFGTVTVNAVIGGLDVPDPVQNNFIVIATAAIAVRYDIPESHIRGN
ncbi:MAG: Lin0512 family protein [Burkholderiaceae bacterium]